MISPEKCKSVFRTTLPVMLFAATGISCIKPEVQPTPTLPIPYSSDQGACVDQSTNIGMATTCFPEGINHPERGTFRLRTDPLKTSTREFKQLLYPSQNFQIFIAVHQEGDPIKFNERIDSALQIGESGGSKPKDTVNYQATPKNPTQSHTISTEWTNWRLEYIAVDELRYTNSG